MTGAVGDAVSGAVQTVDFWTDPWGNTFKSLQDAAHGLAESVLPTVTKATLPNLNASWFLSAYSVAFALAILVAVVLLIPQILRTARGLQAGRELAESIGIFFPLFLIGAMFGPPFGVLLVNFFQAISDSIIRWGVTGPASTVTSKFQSMLTADDAAGIAGGAPVGVLLMILMLTGLLLVVVMLVVQLITLYFTGVLLPLGLVWIIDPSRRRFGTKIVTVWIGILASHPLLFFLLGIAYLMVANSVDAFGSDASLASTVQLIVSVLALFLAGLSPFVLMKLAPVLPTGGGSSGPALTGATIGPQNLTEADNRYSERPPAALSSSSNTGAEEQPSAEAGEPANPASVTAAQSSTPSESPLTATPGGATAPASGTAPVAAPAAGATAATPPTPAGTPAVVAGPAVVSGGTAAAVGGTEAVVAVGAGESATGMGAVVGIPTMLAGAAVTGISVMQDTTETVGAHATSGVEDSDSSGGEAS